jgi:hypothetical protein
LQKPIAELRARDDVDPSSRLRQRPVTNTHLG